MLYTNNKLLTWIVPIQIRLWLLLLIIIVGVVGVVIEKIL